jgi:hypothetical protein
LVAAARAIPHRTPPSRKTKRRHHGAPVDPATPRGSGGTIPAGEKSDRDREHDEVVIATHQGAARRLPAASAGGRCPATGIKTRMAVCRRGKRPASEDR